MKGIPVELLLLLFVAVTIVNFLKQRAAHRRKQAQAGEQPAAEEEDDDGLPTTTSTTTSTTASTTTTSPPTAAPLPPEAPRPMAPQRRAREVPLAPAARNAHLRAARRKLLGGRKGLQEAIVIATIVGRCRADEPPDLGGGGPAPVPQPATSRAGP